MTPTAKLRFVERRVYVNKTAYNTYGDEGSVSELVKKMILQQWWEDTDFLPGTGEWRDVPLEVEQ